MKVNIIAEIGINHFGQTKYLEKYIKSLRGKKIDGLSIQILNKRKTLKKFKKYSLKKNEIKKFVKLAKKNFKLVGVAIHSWNDFEFLSKIKIDFIKILSRSFGNVEYFNNIKLVNNRKIYLATGGKSNKEISSFLNKISCKNLTLIHTFFKTSNFTNSLKKIKIMKKNFGIPVAYGNHFEKIEQIYKVRKYKPSDIFFM